MLQDIERLVRDEDEGFKAERLASGGGAGRELQNREMLPRKPSALQIKRYLKNMQNQQIPYDLSSSDETIFIEVLNDKLNNLIESADSEWKKATDEFWDESNDEYNV